MGNCISHKINPSKHKSATNNKIKDNNGTAEMYSIYKCNINDQLVRDYTTRTITKQYLSDHFVHDHSNEYLHRDYSTYTTVKQDSTDNVTHNIDTHVDHHDLSVKRTASLHAKRPHAKRHNVSHK